MPPDARVHTASRGAAGSFTLIQSVDSLGSSSSLEVERFPASYPALRFAVAGLALGFFELLSLSRLARRASIKLTREANNKLRDASKALEEAQLRIVAVEDRLTAAEFRAQAAETEARDAKHALALVEEAIRTRFQKLLPIEMQAVPAQGIHR